MFRRYIPFLIVLAVAASVTFADAPATQPSPADAQVTIVKLEVRANELMANNDYAQALPMLRLVAQMLSDQPDEVGPILEQIRTCQRQIDNPSTQPAAAPQSVVQAVDGDVRKIHPAPIPGQTVDCPIRELGNFDYDPETGGGIPADIQRLDGVHFRTIGYMIAPDQTDSVSQFVLVPSLFNCCFGKPPQVQHTIVVQTASNKAVPFTPDQVIVEGTLHVGEERDGGFIVSIFKIDDATVKPDPN